MANELLKTIDFGDGIKRAVAPEWYDVQNKPFTTVGGDTLEWDGNTDGLECFALDENTKLYLMSDIYPPMEEFQNGGTVTYTDGSDPMTMEVSATDISGMLGVEGYFGNTGDGMPLLLGVSQDVDSDGMSIKKGLYVLDWGANYGVRLSAIVTINGYTGFTKEKLKADRLPEHTHVWSNIHDTPFDLTDITSDTLTWDGTATSIASSSGAYCISFSTPPEEKLIGCAWTSSGTNENNANMTGILESSNKVVLSNTDVVLWMMDDSIGFMVVYADNAVLDGVTFPKAGIYMSVAVDGLYITELKATSAIFGIQTEKLKADRLPEHTHTWDKIEGKPFEEVVSSISTVSWDGDTTGRDKYTLNGYPYYWISDLQPTKNQLVGGSTVYSNGETYEITGSNAVENSKYLELSDDAILVVYDASVSKPGLYSYYAKGSYNAVITFSTPIEFSSDRLNVENGGTPAVSSADNGKFLQVVDGVWAAVAEVNVQSDWNATSGDAMILNKPTIPTKTSQLTNDSGYLTSHQDISGKADKTYVDEQIGNIGSVLDTINGEVI
jgi:hypothetical protein